MKTLLAIGLTIFALVSNAVAFIPEFREKPGSLVLKNLGFEVAVKHDKGDRWIVEIFLDKTARELPDETTLHVESEANSFYWRSDQVLSDISQYRNPDFGKGGHISKRYGVRFYATKELLDDIYVSFYLDDGKHYLYLPEFLTYPPTK
jgi:hypothetical protein